MADQMRQIRIGKRSITPAALAAMIDRLLECDGARYRRLWAYYRNALLVSAPVGDSAAQRPYRQSQEWGLPSRITGELHPADIAQAPRPAGIARKEVVIENDIGWRIDTLVDYLFGKPLVIRSAAPQPHRRALLDALIRAILAHNGGLLFLQQLALLGSVYGFVDVLVKLDPAAPGPEDDAASRCTLQNLGQPPSTRPIPIARGGRRAEKDRRTCLCRRTRSPRHRIAPANRKRPAADSRPPSNPPRTRARVTPRSRRSLLASPGWSA